jgi:hypothetical protein
VIVFEPAAHPDRISTGFEFAYNERVLTGSCVRCWCMAATDSDLRPSSAEVRSKLERVR